MAIAEPKLRTGALTATSGLRYPRFEKLTTAAALFGATADAEWIAKTPTPQNAPSGPFGVCVLDLSRYRKSDGTIAVAYGSGQTYKRYVAFASTDHVGNQQGASGEGGLWAWTSDSPTTGWSETNSGAPLIDGADLPSGSGDQLEVPRSIEWNPHTEEFVCFMHTEGHSGPTGTEQVTVRLTSTDLVTWSAPAVTGTHPIVLEGQGDHHGYATSVYVDGVLHLIHRVDGKFGFINGMSRATDQEWKHFIATGKRRTGHPQAVTDDRDHSALGIHCDFRLGGQRWAVFDVRDSATHTLRVEQVYIAPLAEDGWTLTGPAQRIISHGSASAWDDTAVHMPAVLVQDDAIYVFYSGQDTSDQGIGVARCRICPDGSYEGL